MKRKDIIPTNMERVMRENDFIVSKTDLNGRILYGNEIFIEFSGYSELELLGSQQNIIRHPDMPRALFKLLWDHLTANKEIFAFVKNMSKDGGFYWVFAQINTMRGADGKKCGYTSVRRMPNPKAIPIITELYRIMLDAEKNAGSKDAMAVSELILTNALNDKGITYQEFVCGLQAL
jgi:PAS domain S-box-containing protein